ncbi:MAG: NAD(P)/FAD-dependent oxidoreductase [Candidatus Brockarchaeota archaeon]|nr:NAD(P)/FAD-dependent oxidoreductase [Candidatus Brockarchaeota archaeon]
MRYDLLVVGAGCAGCMAASTASKLGLKVLLLDRKDEASIGEKVCGDALGSHHLDSLGLALPRECYHSTSPGVEIHSPDLKSSFVIEDESLRAISLDRRAFGQFLLRQAISAGAELVDRFHVSSPIFEGGAVAGVRGIGKDGARAYGARVVAECSGTASVVRRGIPDAEISRPFPKEDVMACYREVRRTKGEALDRLQIYLDQEKTPGGYAWIFPLGEGMVNAGLGIRASEGASPKEAFLEHVAPMEPLAGSTLVNGGGGLVPTSKPMDSMVYDGLMVAGDSASTVSPMHGGGIGSSMLSGKILAEVCAEALSAGSVERKGLWEYNKRYMAAYGAKQASLNVFRKFLQDSTNEEINFGMAHGIVKPSDVLLASKVGDLNLSITDKATRAFRGIGKLDFLVRLRRTARVMKAVKKLYLEYPDFEGFAGWVAKVRAVESSLKPPKKRRS